MISAQSLLYIILTVCLLVLTSVVVILAIQIMQVLQEIKIIARNLEMMTTLIERVAQVVFPGMERVAKRADHLEQKVANFVSEKVEQLTKKYHG